MSQNTSTGMCGNEPQDFHLYLLKVKWCLCTQWRCRGEFKYSFTHS